MISPYRLLFLDLDGTLIVRGDEIPEPNLRAIHRAQEAGCVVVLCTGRTRYRAQRVADQIGGHEYGIILNGGVVFDWQTGEQLHKVTLAPETAHQAIAILHSFQIAPLCFAVEENDRWVYTDRVVPLAPAYADYFAERIRTQDTLDWSRLPPPVSIEAYASAPQAAQILTRWKRAFGDTVVAYTWDASYYGESVRGLHIHSSKINKAVGAQTVAARLGIAREQTLAIGDEINDYELIRWAGMGIAMQNGHPDCRAIADHVTASVQEHGVAQAIERFILQAKSCRP
jgi:Cof subfamily protein (haloacid dehalogenase superfamily)